METSAEKKKGIPMKRMVIGLTGGISSGKSTVSAFLSQLGAVIINADQIGHESFRPNSDIWREVVKTFGAGIIGAGGEIDRQKLGEIVFNDPTSLDKLNEIMHPAMYRVVEQKIKELEKQGHEVIVLEAPLLVEAGWLPLVDKVWVTIADEGTIVQRLCRRNGLTEAQAMARIYSQLPAAEKVKYAEAVINTDGTMDEVEARVEKLWRTMYTGGVKERIRQALAGRVKQNAENDGMASAAVLIPIYDKDGQYYLIVTKRTEDVYYHKGQISFPGGKFGGEDRNLRDTALRESCEEIGLKPGDVEILGELDDILTNTGFVVSPFVAVIPYPYEFRKNDSEVDEIIEVPIVALLDDNNVKESLSFRNGESVTDYTYEYGDWLIWGATARMLSQFLKIVSGV